MFNNVLIAENYVNSQVSAQDIVSELSISKVDHVCYCDDAFSKVQKALSKGDTYDLLITDLNFEDNHYLQQFRSGEDLIEVVKEVQPDIKVIVFSTDIKSSVIGRLFKERRIDAYVRKSKYETGDLKRAITALSKNGKYLAIDLKKSVRRVNSYEFSDYDIVLISLLAQGMLVKHIPFYLKNNNIKPCGLSSVEKRINQLRGILKVISNEQLVDFCKKSRLI